MDPEVATAESATGCVARAQDGGPFWKHPGVKISDVEARKLFREGVQVHAPNAGAGSYKSILNRLGFTAYKVEDWTSSSGDWCFAIWGQRLVFQANRYPYHGFAYSMCSREDATL